MNNNLLMLEENDIALYEDMCHQNDMCPSLVHMTKEQAHILISLRKNWIVPEFSSSGERYWRIPWKRAQWWKLTQKTAQKFFLSEK